MFEKAHTFNMTQDRKQLRRDIRRPMLIAVVLAILFFGVGGAWAVLAPIGSAAIAEGTISPEGHRKSVQHLEGGIVRDVVVREGDMVAAGDILVIMENIQALAAFRVLESRLVALRATEARLEAEITNSTVLDWVNVPLVEGRDEAIDDQKRIFAAREESIASQQQILRQRIQQLREEIGGLEQQIVSQDRQLGLINEEEAMVADLIEKGLARRPRLLELQREQANIMGRRAANVASIARARQSIGEADLQILGLGTERRNQAAAELGEVRAQLVDISERMTSSRDTLERTVIRAPAAGVVFNLTVQTNGGVLRPGEALMEIVPEEGDLLIDARISPNDIDVVRAGLEADVTLTAFPQRNIPPLHGIVRQVSADSLQDEQTGELYYLARIQIDPVSMEAAGIADELIPGMPASTMIFTGTQTFADYIIGPMLDSIDRSFRES